MSLIELFKKNIKVEAEAPKKPTNLPLYVKDDVIASKEDAFAKDIAERIIYASEVKAASLEEQIEIMSVRMVYEALILFDYKINQSFKVANLKKYLSNSLATTSWNPVPPFFLYLEKEGKERNMLAVVDRFYSSLGLCRYWPEEASERILTDEGKKILNKANVMLNYVVSRQHNIHTIEERLSGSEEVISTLEKPKVSINSVINNPLQEKKPNIQAIKTIDANVSEGQGIANWDIETSDD